MSDIQAGTYRARAVSAALGETSTGSEQVAVEFELLDVEGNAGPHIVWYGYFTEKTVKTTIKALRTCGWTGDLLTDLSGIDTNEVSLVIEEESDQNGRMRPRVRWVNAPGGAGLSLKAPLDGEKARAFAAKMRSRIAAMDQAEGASKPKPRATAKPILSPEPPPHDDSDLPF
jgi:hypothetical protein